MKFSELLTEYLELRDEGDVHGEWRSIDDRARENRQRRARSAELLADMDKLVSAGNGEGV